jgi:orotidine-5'-phosphate decarboxylase
MLSHLPCVPSHRLIIALDGLNIDQAKALVKQLGENGVFYKIGLELFMSGEYFNFLDWLDRQGKLVFADLKLFDIPQTVASSIAQLARTTTKFVTVHGNQDILAAAVGAKADMQVLAVTALTSMDNNDLQDLGFQCNVEELVFSRAKRALEVGCDGIVSSGLEVSKIRQEFADKLITVIPGIRPVQNSFDDQKRSVSLSQAFNNGADYIVVGRPIVQTDNPSLAANNMQQEIAQIFA